MTENRNYQYDFSTSSASVHDVESRTKKADTMVAVLSEHFEVPLNQLYALDIGASTGVIANSLADYFASITGLDIDIKAIEFAKKSFHKSNLYFREGDALHTSLPNDSVDVVICSQVYEHVPDSQKMIAEIYRILRPGGVCYFAAGNRLMWNEPHYNLPLLSVVPRKSAHWYIRMSGKARHYHELHFSYWGLKNLVKNFEIIDYTKKMISDPERYGITYMLKPKSRKAVIAQAIAKYAYWLVPGYIWLLKKPGFFIAQSDNCSLL